MSARHQHRLARLNPCVVFAIGVAAFTLGAIATAHAQGVFERMWGNFAERPSGSLHFRFILQPLMASIFAIRDGIGDARTGRSPYFWTVLSNPEERGSRLREGIKATSKILILAFILDVVYQYIEFKTFFPVEAIIIAFLLGFIPYLILRGPVARIVRWYGARYPSGGRL